MAKRFFEYHDDKSDKFWEIEDEGKLLKVRFGRCSTAGQRQQKEFGSEGEVLKAAEKLVREKVRKGYVEKTAGQNAGTVTYGLKVHLSNGKNRAFPNFEVGSDLKLPGAQRWEVSLPEGTTPAQMKKIIADLNERDLAYVEINSIERSEDLLSEIHTVRNLRSLCVVGTMSDKTMKLIGQCSSLEELAIGIEPLKAVHHLGGLEDNRRGPQMPSCAQAPEVS